MMVKRFWACARWASESCVSGIEDCAMTSYLASERVYPSSALLPSISQRSPSCQNSVHGIPKFTCALSRAEVLSTRTPFRYRWKGEAACVEEQHSSRCEARRQCTDDLEPARKIWLTLRPMLMRGTSVCSVVLANKCTQLRHFIHN